MKRAVVLTSGGIDSTTALAIALQEGFECCALSFDYGQRHAVEIQKAREVCRVLDVQEHHVIQIDLRQIAGSALTSDQAVPKSRTAREIGSGIPVTYVPARNTIFLSFALAWAEVWEARAIFTGVNALDYSGYPDCRPEYIQAFQHLAHLATRSGVEHTVKLEIRTPLIQMTKVQIIRRGLQLDVPFHLTHSCYDPSPEGQACGSCDSCLLRKKGFEEAGVPDPIGYPA